MTIFISIASYRDPLLTTTVTEAYINAKNKDDLVFGIVDQGYLGETIDIPLLSFKNQIRYLRIDPEFARGAAWPRNLAQSMWNNEDFYLQIDSHTMFDPNWDEILINQYNELKKYHSKPVITTYPHAFEVIDKDITNLKKTRFSGHLVLKSCDKFSNNVNDMYIHTNSTMINCLTPVHGFLISGNFLFTQGRVCEDVPYDPYLYFSGEEHSYALRLWTNGYNIFHDVEIPIYTNYNRNYRVVSWDDSEDKRIIKWWQHDIRSKERLKKIVTGQDVGKYGLGSVRTLDQYIKWTGIDYLNRIIDNRAVTGADIFALDYKGEIII